MCRLEIHTRTHLFYLLGSKSAAGTVIGSFVLTKSHHAEFGLPAHIAKPLESFDIGSRYAWMQPPVLSRMGNDTAADKNRRRNAMFDEYRQELGVASMSVVERDHSSRTASSRRVHVAQGHQLTNTFQIGQVRVERSRLGS